VKPRFRFAVVAGLLLAGALHYVVAGAEDDARADCKRKNICSVLIERYDANPRRPATLGEVLIAASEASAYGAKLPTPCDRPVVSTGKPDPEQAARLSALETFARSSLPESMVGEIRKSEQYMKKWAQENLGGATGSGGKDPRVDAVLRDLRSLTETEGSHFGALNGNVVTLSATVADMKERLRPVEGSMMQKALIGAGVAAAAVLTFALTGLK
jgi:hypothetical protein